MAGRGKKLQLTKEQWDKMGEYAFNGCLNGTIADLMDIPETTIHCSVDIRRFLKKKRAERKFALHKAQLETAFNAKNAIMQIFLGKNELGQADKQEGQIGGEIHVHIHK